MLRVLSIAGLVLAAAGCQTQNPFAAIGPATVPAPTTGQAPPYYPPTVTGAAPANAGTPPVAASTQHPPRVSVSAEGSARISASPGIIVADPADGQPIRIVENTSPAIRTANARAPGAAPANNIPSGAPNGTSVPPTNRIPTGTPSGYSPPGTTPATSRMRGFASTPPAGNPAGSRTIAPASYQEAVPTFSEAKPADGQWRAR